MQTQDAAAPVPTNLPDIALSEIPETTKDFLLAHSASGKSIPEVILDVLDRAATDAGFPNHGPSKAA
ncbi:MAG: hypothetical protein ABIT37_03835 [Luteolibacter sp.]